MLINEGLALLEIEMQEKNCFYPVLLWDENETILFDTGMPWQQKQFETEIEKYGKSIKDLTKIILTHQDFDHIGGLAILQRASGGKAKIFSHVDEKPYIQFEKPPVKGGPDRFGELAVGLSKMGLISEASSEKAMELLKTQVDITFNDGNQLDILGGLEVIHAPGHTPGNICIYLKAYKVLISGDTVNIADGKLVGPNPVYTPNMELAIESLKKLLNYDIKAILCYHGGIFQGDIEGDLQAIILNNKH